MKVIFIKILFACFIVLFLPFFMSSFLNKNTNNDFNDINFEIIDDSYGQTKPMDFNTYLLGVIAANIPASYELESLKAQAIISRTYILHNISQLKENNHKKEKFLTSEIGPSYINPLGLEKLWDKEDFKENYNKILKAIKSTNNQTIYYDDSLILPVFFDTGSGYTRNAHEAWGINIPYLISKPSSQDKASVNYIKVIELDIQELLDLLITYLPDKNLSVDNIYEKINIEKRDSIGYVIEIKIDNYILAGEEFAKILGLPSNNFIIEKHGGKVRFVCTGTGHGIGLSQFGANSMAMEGSSYREILNHYYSGISIKDSSLNSLLK